MYGARETSVTVIPARDIVTWKCKECGLEHYGLRSDLAASRPCSLAKAA